jgi:hypothetical protein
MVRNFKTYSKQELFEKIDAIEIFKEGEQVITKYFGTVINTTPVSKRYEIFDIRAFLKDKINHIESNFNITYYRFIMKRGTQELTLLSDSVDINGNKHYKSFFILNSSDKSRRLNMNLGLYRSDNGIYFVSGINNMSLSKKHLTGLTKAAEEVAVSIDGETFNEQIESIKSLVGERVLFSKVREIIVDKEQKINHRKFDAFKNQLSYSNIKWTKEQYALLRTESEKLVIDSKSDFDLDAYMVFNLYMQVFRNQDSYVVKKETERIIKITQCFIRNEKLEQLLMEI